LQTTFGSPTPLQPTSQTHNGTVIGILLFVALAFILVNLWIYLLWDYVSVTRRGGRKIDRNLFPLKTMLGFLAHAVE
jgi:hypothetical protein